MPNENKRRLAEEDLRLSVLDLGHHFIQHQSVPCGWQVSSSHHHLQRFIRIEEVPMSSLQVVLRDMHLVPSARVKEGKVSTAYLCQLMVHLPSSIRLPLLADLSWRSSFMSVPRFPLARCASVPTRRPTAAYGVSGVSLSTDAPSKRRDVRSAPET
jgi:hypothetical protein